MTSKKEKKQFADSKKPTQILALKNQENEKTYRNSTETESTKITIQQFLKLPL